MPSVFFCFPNNKLILMKRKKDIFEGEGDIILHFELLVIIIFNIKKIK
jgi:hypothetical protein